MKPSLATVPTLLAAAAGRLLYLMRRACGHDVTCRLSPDSPQPLISLFERLQDVLRLAAQCPSGPAGNDIRRAACELIEASSVGERNTGRRRLLKAIAGAQGRLSSGRSRPDDPSALVLRRLTDALQGELQPGAAPQTPSRSLPVQS